MMAASSTRCDLEDAVQSALFRLAAEYNQRAAGRIIHALQRRHASGVFGDDYEHKSLWDELCHDAQSGPHFDDDEPLDSILDALLQKEVERLTAAEFEALWLAAIVDVDDLITAPRDAGVIKEEFRSALLQRAGERNLERFEIW
ncbi:hypothetical protein FHS26_001586 [Rhizobium pisi]|uniref:Uncharacterized protein n=1 Tax=Rhizobium pisi TaxID=574561 RepID=A0A427N4P5_9HYPH|nr:hypothetical protein [Rhizobium pisi]MBB3133873.1 hypothetical protein [Rhizobium pisi]RSB81854.1 hypothetical protein EFD55_07885 [Rhizobium pisi]TCA39279.1 hypothetical protein E0J16_35175 [Rhizobium pisi]